MVAWPIQFFLGGEEVASIIILHSTWKSRMHQVLFVCLCWCLLICSLLTRWMNNLLRWYWKMIMWSTWSHGGSADWRTCPPSKLMLLVFEDISLQECLYHPISYNLLSDLVQQNQGYQGQAMIQARSVENSIGRRGVACSWGLAIAASGFHSVHLLQKARVQRWEGAWQQGCEYVILHNITHIIYIYNYAYVYIYIYIHTYRSIKLRCIALPYTTLHHI